MLNRRSFLATLFGTAVVAAAGPIPKIILDMPEKDFVKIATTFVESFNGIIPSPDEVYGDDKGNYGFARLEYINEPPFFKVMIPEGFRPLRAESDRINSMVMMQLTGSKL